jgi:glycosyltransferase involved in cell wall biosynthesis
LRLCFLCNEYPPGPHGGIGTLVQTFARSLVEAGHAVRVVGVYGSSYPAPDTEDDRGVRVVRLRESGGPAGWVRSRIRLFRTVATWVNAGDVELVEAPDWEGWAAGWPRLSAPVVVRLSGSASYFADELGRRLRRMAFWLERASLRRADFICSESRYLAGRTTDVFGLSRGPDAVIYNPVEAPPAAELPRDPNRILFAGTLTTKKGIRSLLAAWPLVLREVPSATLHVFGKDGHAEEGGSMQQALKSSIESRGVTGVTFRGHVTLDALVEEFRHARAIVLPSYAEGFSLTPLHAMAAGCPTVYTRRGSGPEVIEDGRDGLLIDPDDPAGIASAIVRLLRDDALSARLGAAGRDTVRRRFSRETLAAENAAFYRSCLARAAGEHSEAA